MEWFLLILLIVIAYLIGSISTAILVGRILTGGDIRSHGSGNAGATNALRTYGKKAALWVVFGDCLKAIIAIVLGLIIAKFTPLSREYAIYGAGVGAVLGHNFPLYFKFHGGKGVLVSTMAMLFADWKIGIIVFVVAILIMALTRYVSLGSVIGALLFFVLGVISHWGNWVYILFSAILAVLLVIMHRANISRLISGTESKLGQKKE